MKQPNPHTPPTPTLNSSKDILVVLFLRGGCDGLNFVGPSADPIYINERRAETRVERDGDHPGLVLANNFADNDFRIHFKAQKLKELYDQKHLAIVHACGLTNGTRSHFEAMDYMERGTPDNKNTSSGWLTRLIAQQRLQGSAPVVSTSNALPTSLLACAPAMPIPNTRKIQLQGNPKFKAVQEKILTQRYQGTSLIARNGVRILGTVDKFLQKLPHDAQGKPQDYTPTQGVNYPTEGYTNELSNAFKTLAQLIKMDVGVQFATMDYGGWDTHVGQGGRFPNLVDTVSRSLGAFWDDMKSYQDRLTVVVMSEFGRRLKGNDSGGTDHGHGNAMFILGGHVNGGNIYGKWPGLQNEHLDNQVDLAITTDYRTVLSEIITQRFNAHDVSSIFPKYVYGSPLGILNT